MYLWYKNKSPCISNVQHDSNNLADKISLIPGKYTYVTCVLKMYYCRGSPSADSNPVCFTNYKSSLTKTVPPN
jgi:hypothetical protein